MTINRSIGLLIVTLGLAWPAMATTYVVNQNDPTATYKTIQSAIGFAQPGDTIAVYPGTYQCSANLFMRPDFMETG